jgi:hypothetical protein
MDTEIFDKKDESGEDDDRVSEKQRKELIEIMLLYMEEEINTHTFLQKFSEAFDKHKKEMSLITSLSAFNQTAYADI